MGDELEREDVVGLDHEIGAQLAERCERRADRDLTVAGVADDVAVDRDAGDVGLVEALDDLAVAGAEVDERCVDEPFGLEGRDERGERVTRGAAGSDVAAHDVAGPAAFVPGVADVFRQRGFALLQQIDVALHVGAEVQVPDAHVELQ